MQAKKHTMTSWRLPKRTLTIGERPLVMGIVNVTPDSFSDGGQFKSTAAAVAHALELVKQGADLLDIGGESTRPGATPVPLDQELQRVVPVVEALAGKIKVPISVDTSKAAVARQCLKRGAEIINDVTALTGDPEMLEVAAESRAGVVLMHMLGTPATMQIDPRYRDVVGDLLRFFRRRLAACKRAGLQSERLVIDPGIGFGKTQEHTLTLLARLEEFQRLGRPVLLGVSRKGYIGLLIGKPRQERMIGTVATLCYAVARGAVQIVRVHDVAPVREALTIGAAIREHRKRKEVRD
jgi:dihydropteroate synthase